MSGKIVIDAGPVTVPAGLHGTPAARKNLDALTVSLRAGS
jgi:hypothetical protein